MHSTALGGADCDPLSNRKSMLIVAPRRMLANCSTKLAASPPKAVTNSPAPRRNGITLRRPDSMCRQERFPAGTCVFRTGNTQFVLFAFCAQAEQTGHLCNNCSFEAEAEAVGISRRRRVHSHKCRSTPDLRSCRIAFDKHYHAALPSRCSPSWTSSALAHGYLRNSTAGMALIFQLVE